MWSTGCSWQENPSTAPHGRNLGCVRRHLGTSQTITCVLEVPLAWATSWKCLLVCCSPTKPLSSSPSCAQVIRTEFPMAVKRIGPSQIHYTSIQSTWHIHKWSLSYHIFLERSLGINVWGRPGPRGSSFTPLQASAINGLCLEQIFETQKPVNNAAFDASELLSHSQQLREKPLAPAPRKKPASQPPPFAFRPSPQRILHAPYKGLSFLP